MQYSKKHTKNRRRAIQEAKNKIFKQKAASKSEVREIHTISSWSKTIYNIEMLFGKYEKHKEQIT